MKPAARQLRSKPQARMARTLSTLLAAGIPLIDAQDITAKP
jgi:type II secretory pathway component PulF